jgi:hypothetical protein
MKLVLEQFRDFTNLRNRDVTEASRSESNVEEMIGLENSRLTAKFT